MAIVEETVLVTLAGRNTPYYKDREYFIPTITDKKGKTSVPRGTKIEVKVKDLPRKSNIKLHKICDYCLKPCEKPQIYQDIINCREKSGGIDCCNECHGKAIKEKCKNRTNVPRGKSLAEKHPELIKDFCGENLKNPNEVYSNSHEEYLWQCPSYKEHKYYMSIDIRTNQGQGCPFCASKRVHDTNSLYSLYPDIAKEWHPTLNGDLKPNDVISGSHKKVWWLGKCGHEWETRVEYRTLNKSNCFKCYIENRFINFNGDTNPNWNGGVTESRKYLRDFMSEWKKDSFKNSNYKCVLSDSKVNLEIHHLYGFEMIIQEIFIELNIDIRVRIKDYSDEELRLLESKCLEIHYRHPLGVCLTRDIHKLFHNQYGVKNNTHEQFEEFKIRYSIGEFKEVS